MRGYTDEQMSWLAINANGKSWHSLTAAFNKRYGTKYSVNRLKTHCNRHGIFVTEPLNGKPSWNAKPLGHICSTSSGYMRVKTEQGYKMLARTYMPKELMQDYVCCYFGDRVKYHRKTAMRQFALQTRYNKGFMAQRETAMAVCELEVKIKELR